MSREIHSELFERVLRECNPPRRRKLSDLRRVMLNEASHGVKIKSLKKLQWLDDELYQNASIEDALESAMETFKDDLIGKVFRTKDKRYITFTERGYRELFYSITAAISDVHEAAADVYRNREKDDPNYLFDVLSVVASLPEIITSMRFVRRRENIKVSYNLEKQAVAYYDTYKCNVIIDGDERECFVRVEVPKVESDTHGYYFHYLDESVQILEIDRFTFSRF